MLGSLFRMAMLAGTGAEVAAGFRRTMLKLACLLAVVIVVGLLIAGAIGAFGFAIYAALLPEVGPIWSAVIAGAALIVVAAMLAVGCRAWYFRKRRRVPSGAAAAGLGGLGGPLGAAALGASLGAGPNFDMREVLGRNAMTILLTAFIAGMVMNNRKR